MYSFKPLKKLVLTAILGIAGAAWPSSELLSQGTKVTQTRPQATAKPAVPPKSEPDYSKQALVVESAVIEIRFENDGRGKRTQRMRVCVQSEAGVQQLGQLAFPYNSANEKMEIGYVRVVKSGGTVVGATAGDIQDLNAPVTREAPVYTDLREKHVTVPALRPGETLEYETTTITETPLAPGQFWLEHNFMRDVIVLDEQLVVNVPRSRDVKLKTQRGKEPAVTEESERRIYRWKQANKELPEENREETPKKNEEQQGPDVQMTTFRDWAEVGVWYGALARERATVTPEVRMRADQLLAGRAGQMERIEGLYDYVSKNFRYVSLSFGMGRFQPHAASSVLANQYGDCKDKHTLLESLLEASGIRAFPALVSSRRKLDEEMPSPAQFDHLITAVPVGDELIWLDTTLEVAPFRLLAAPLRDKQALLIPRDGPARLVKTPADPPFPSTQRVEVNGKISPLGKLTAQVRYVLRGDTELLLRMAFRRTPQSKWKDLGQLIAWSDGLRGEVTLIHPSDPAETAKPFQIEYDVSIPNYLEWTRKRSEISLPIPTIGMPTVAPDASKGPDAKPLDLGTPADIQLSLKLELPETVKTQAPVAMGLSRDYAEYRSAYKMEGTTLTAERTIQFRMRELPASRASDYLAFQRAVRTDESQTLSVETTTVGAGTPEIPESVKTKDLYDAGQAAYRNRNFSVAVDLFKRVVEKEPHHKDAWNDLGLAHMAQSQLQEAEGAFRKQIEANSFDEYAHNNLGRVLWLEKKYDEAITAFQKQIEVNPLDPHAHANLGSLYRDLRRYPEAAGPLEKAVSIAPRNPGLRTELGATYLRLGEKGKALAAFEEALELAPTPTTWNNVAYEMAEANVELDRAQQYAESAVGAVQAVLRNASLDRLTLAEVAAVSQMAAYWDTLGWIYFHKGDLTTAQRYTEASWLLGQSGEVGDHLGQIYEKQGRTADAMRVYAQALAASRSLQETRGRLEQLAGSRGKADELARKGGEHLAESRTVNLGPWPKNRKKADAEFTVLISPGPKVEEVKFLSGSEQLRSMADSIRAAKYEVKFPDDAPMRLMRRGVLSCAPLTGKCVFVLILPSMVTRVD